MVLPKEVDIIVCGGGSAGCVVAGRLANLDHNLQVLLIEAGENNLNNPWVYRPGIYPRNMKLDSKTATFYRTRPSNFLAGREMIVPQAHILGGGSSINFMMYTRASASDYDDWQTKGWSTKELLPLMRKHETYQRPCNNRDIHGFDGPIKVSFGNYTFPIKDDFLRAVESQGIPFVDDLQDLTTAHGAEHWLKWINKDLGKRSDSAHAYIHSTMRHHQNLHLLCNTKVSRVIFDGDTAVGVETVPTKPLVPEQLKPTVYSARRQIILSSGTVSTPLILERSGVGDPAILRKAGVQVKVELPGVGKNFQDHYLTFTPYRAKPEVDTTDDFCRGDPAVQAKVYEQWERTRGGPLSTNAIEAGVKIRPTAEEIKSMGPEFEKGYNEYFANKPDKPVMHYSIIAGWFGDHTLMPPGKFFTMFHFLEYPFSRGEVHIRSANPYAAPDFDNGFLNHKADVGPMMWAYKKSRETARRMESFAGEVTSMHPQFRMWSDAACKDVDLKTANRILPEGNLTAGLQHGSWKRDLEPESAPDVSVVTSSRAAIREGIKYDSEDDKAIEQWVEQHIETTWHCLGTCSMAPKEGSKVTKYGGVLDPRLNVHGTRRLKVADLSVCPDNVGCNTYSTALLIGEKAAVLIAEDLGYSGEALRMDVPPLETHEWPNLNAGPAPYTRG